MNKLKLSLITSCYNAEKFIDETAESILSQNYDNWEWLISDDFSTDNTYQSIEKISQKSLKIPAGTQHGTEFRIKNRGVSYLRGKGKGDQYVIVNIEIPKNVSDEQKKLLEKYRELN